MDDHSDSFGDTPNPRDAATDEPAPASHRPGKTARALVPAQRQDGFTPKRRAKFLKALRKTGCVEDACRAVRISDSAAYKCRRRDPAFAALWQTALSKAGSDIETFAWKFAVEGVEEDIVAYGKVIGTRRKRDPQLFRMLLQGSNPARYGGHGYGSRKQLEKQIRKEIAADQEMEGNGRADELRERIMGKHEVLHKREILAGRIYEDEHGQSVPTGYIRDPEAPWPPPHLHRQNEDESGDE